MALKESNMLELGTSAPEFTLYDTVTDRDISLYNGRNYAATLVMFLCNHCPYVIHVNPEIVRLAHDYMPRSVRFLAISSNDVEKYPQDGPEKMHEQARKVGYPFPYLYDETQEVARVFDAACTPDFYLFDKNKRLVYRGRLDESRPGNEKPLNGKDLREALDALLEGKPVPSTQYPSAGCSIKWKK